MKKIIWIIVAVVVVGSIIWVSGSKKSTPVSGEPIKIGAFYALTGPAAKFGELSARGARDAATYFEQKTGQKTELIIEDTANDPKQGVSATQKLFNIDKVKYAVVSTSGITAAISSLADQYQSILITDAAGYGLTKDKQYLFQNFLPSLNDVAKRINSSEKSKKVAIVYINDEFGNIWNQKTLEALMDKEHKSFPFQKDTKDFKTDASKIKSFKPDVIFVLGYGPALNQVYADLATQKVESDIISYLSCTLPGVLSDVRYSLNGRISYEYPVIKDKDISKWITAHNGQFNTFYLLAFENTLIALNTAKDSRGDTAVALNYLKTKKLPMLYGDISFNENNVVERDLEANIIEDGKCKPI